MANVSQALHAGESIDHTPASAVTAGNIIQLGAIAAFAPEGIAASVLGAVATRGVLRVPHTATLGNIGDNVWWDTDGTPYGGTNDGAATTNAAAGDFWIGTLLRATGVTDSTCDVALNQVNPNLPAWQGKTHFKVVADTTLVAATHSGGVIHVGPDAGADTVITLPAAVAGMDYIVQNDAADGGLYLKVAPNGTEIFAGANLTLTNGQDAFLTLLTGVRGDYLWLVANVNATSWRVVAKRGIWACS